MFTKLIPAGSLLFLLSFQTATAVEPTTPQEAAGAAGACMVCSVQQDYPQLQGKVRQEVLNTQHGFLIVTTVLDESLLPDWLEMEQDRESKRVTAMKLDGESQAERLCWFCQATFALESREDATVEHLRTSSGNILLATGASREATAVLQSYATLAANRVALLDKAGYR